MTNCPHLLCTVGRYCEYQNRDSDRSNEFDTFDGYMSTLELVCNEGTPGSFTWTPDENTPDMVYYQVQPVVTMAPSNPLVLQYLCNLQMLYMQCATHQFLGWSMCVSDRPPSPTPSAVTPHPTATLVPSPSTSTSPGNNTTDLSPGSAAASQLGAALCMLLALLATITMA